MGQGIALPEFAAFHFCRVAFAILRDSDVEVFHRQHRLIHLHKLFGFGKRDLGECIAVMGSGGGDRKFFDWKIKGMGHGLLT